MADADTDHRELGRLVGLAHHRTTISHRASAVQLYRDARDVAEQAVPGALGEAVAGVLAQAAYERGASQMPGMLGASKLELALALAVLDLAITTPPAGEDSTEAGRGRG